MPEPDPRGPARIDFAGAFVGHRVVVTGACGLFGRWIAEAFAEAGADVCLSDNRTDALEALRGALAERHPDASFLAHATELTDDASLDALLELVAAEWTAPDVLVNNAGVYPSGFLLDTDNAEWDRIMDINVRAPFVLARGFATRMVRAGTHGSIVNIGSGAAGKMRRTVVPYCLSKSALDRLTKGLALELAEHGIRVNTLEPGFAAGSEVSALSDEHVAAVSGSIPLGRTSEPSDAAHAVLYLCSVNAGYVTGASLAVDGGNSAGTMTVFQDKRTAL